MTLTKYEKEIMDLMWRLDKPVTRGAILEESEQSRSWTASSIHIFLNSLLKKGAIEVAGFVKDGRRYGRTYLPTIRPEEYAVLNVKAGNVDSVALIMELIDQCDEKERARVYEWLREEAENDHN